MIIQYILNEEKKEQQIETCYVLPVTPREVKKSKSANVSSIALLNYGSVTSGSNRELEEIELSSFFPATNYGFVEDNIRSHRYKLPPVGCYHHKTLLTPEEYIRQFQELVNTGKPFSIRIDTIVPIWKHFIVKSFHYGLDDGSGDTGYSLTLLEYRTPKKTVNGVELKERQQKLPAPETYVVVKGDTLSAIAKRFTGDGENWRKIASDNGVEDPKFLQIGTELVIK